MFDFLKSKDVPVAGQVGPNGLTQAPTMEHQPGAWERYRTPNDQGVSMADRILMASMVMNDQGPGAMAYGANLRKRHDDTADRAKKNAAIKAAYDPATGKFRPDVYMANIGPEADASEAFALQKELGSKTGVDGSFAYSVDPDGQVHWGEQRPMSHAEEAQIAKEAEAQRHAQEMEAYYRQMARAAMQNAGANEYRAHKPPASGGGSSWLPAGAHVIHIPGQ